MSDSSTIFYQGLCDGVAASEGTEKVASVFFQGLVDGVSEASREPIMSKIAHLVSSGDEGEEHSITDRMINTIRG